MTLRHELRRRWWLVLAFLAAAVVLFGARIATFYTDVLWFTDVGFLDLFWGLLRTQAGLGVLAAVLLGALLGGNLLLARRLSPPYRMPSAQEEGVERYRQTIEPYARPLLLAVAAVVGVLSGIAMVGQWPTFLLWANAVPFGMEDPQFGRDLGYFVFVLPFHSLVNSWLFTALALTIGLTALAHYIFGGIRPQSPGQKITPLANVHLSVLLAALVAVRAWGFRLDQFMLSYSPRGQVTGLSYTDANAQLRALQLLMVIAAVCVVLFLVNIRVRGWLLPSAGVGILLVAAVLLSGIYPAVIQRLQVDPQELEREEQYIERNLELTRFGYRIGPDDVTYESFDATADLTAEEVVDNAATLESVRLWDPATLQNTYQQLQEFRPYYDFRDVDVDRYEIDGRVRQLMLGAREISERDLPRQARTWQNERLYFTHGFGLVSSRVSTAGPDGQPEFVVRDLPPQTVDGAEALDVENPRIYFGEASPEYSIVGTSLDELDYPLEGGQEEYRYTGEAGVPVGSPLRRLAFAFRYAEPNIVLSGLITDESKILFKRDIRERVESVAPFLKLDHDPYPVAVDGRIKWIVDGYTTSNMLPYSERIDLAAVTRSEQRRLVPVQGPDGAITLQEQIGFVPGLTGGANYLRNSVKAVVDAYDGTISLYVVDTEDPVIEAWGRAFPGVLTPLEEASDDLRDHFRYPEDLFLVQSELLRTYHIPDAAEFYTKQDAWNLPSDSAFFANQAPRPAAQREVRPMPPTYQLIRLPQETEERFSLVQPFTPAERNNLTAYLAGHVDTDGSGDLKVLLMPPNRTVFGPEQVQARIDQDPAVAQQITLWNQSGSGVIYGNLIVVPIEGALLYSQPLFLRAQQSEIPELRRSVLVYGDQVVMEETLADSVERVFGATVPGLETPDDGQPVDPGEEPPDDLPRGDLPADPRVAALITQALTAFEEADAALREGDLGTYQERTSDAEELLRQAESLLGGAVPDASPAPEPEDQATTEAPAA